MGVILVAYGLQFEHVFARDALVSSLIEEDGWIVAVVDDGIAHQFHALIPSRSGHVLFGIAGWHGLYQSHSVARFHILFPGRYVHPAHQVGSRFHHQGIAVVAQPCGYGETHARPLVGGALGIAMHHDDTVVEPDFSLAKTGLPESRPGDDCIALCAVGILEHRLHLVEIAVAPRPEVQSTDGACGLQRSGLSGLDGDRVAVESGYGLAVGIGHLGYE